MTLIPLSEAGWERYFRLLFWVAVFLVPLAAVSFAIQGLFYFAGVDRDVSAYFATPVGLLVAAYVTLRVYRADPLGRRRAGQVAAFESVASAEGSRYAVIIRDFGGADLARVNRIIRSHVDDFAPERLNTVPCLVTTEVSFGTAEPLRAALAKAGTARLTCRRFRIRGFLRLIPRSTSPLHPETPARVGNLAGPSRTANRASRPERPAASRRGA
jgi:hypothetical protein